MGNTQRQSFVIFPPEADLVCPPLTPTLQPRNIFHTVKCNLLDPNKIGIKAIIVISEKESEGLGESGLRNSFAVQK